VRSKEIEGVLQYIVGNRFTGVTATSCNQRHRESNYNDVMVMQKNPCAVPRFSHRAFRARKAFQSRHVHVQNKSIPFHVKYATQHTHKNCLCTITSSYRHLASNYTLLLNASITYTICRPEIPLHIYLSVIRQ